MWDSVPEHVPRDVATPLPLSPEVTPESYTYDYIIVGGGTSGCVLASRLTEDPNISVLVIERGPVSDSWMSRAPLISANIYDKSNLSEKWWSLPLRHANNRYLEVIRGEALGGTSRVNGLFYTRGCPGDYNQWKALGNEGWGYDDLQPYFVKSEKTHSHPGSEYRGTNGVWQNRTFLNMNYKAVECAERVAHKVGIPRITDGNSPHIPAAHIGPVDVIEDSKYRRHSTFHAFLPPKICQQRKARLKICPNSIVCSVELATTGDGVQATGVHFEMKNSRKAGSRYVAKARREVIVCAGAIGSPHVLMLSGLGPKAHLEEKGIHVFQDMPAVGSHLSDHVGVTVAVQTPIQDSLHRLEVSPLTAVIELLKYITTGRGLISLPFHTVSAYYPTRLLDPSHGISSARPEDLDASIPNNRPDIEMLLVPNNCADVDTDRIGVFTFPVILIRPQSTGTIRLATANPRANPDIDLNFLADPADYVPLRAGIRVAMRIFDGMRAEGYPIVKNLEYPPGGTNADDATLDAYIRENLRTCFHYTSTCRMGVAAHGERPSVVDAELRVHGVHGLRVCDASVFPEIIGGHTMAPAVVVAEKCADLLKTEWA